MITHGMSKTLEYYSWKSMTQRCCNPKNPAYKRYGERGIAMCQRWRKFENFFADMGLRPSKKHQIDRIDNDGDYEPSNCRWVTSKENARNTSASKWWFINGVKYDSAQQAADALNVTQRTIQRWCEGQVSRGVFYPPKKNCYSEFKYKKTLDSMKYSLYTRHIQQRGELTLQEPINIEV